MPAQRRRSLYLLSNGPLINESIVETASLMPKISEEKKRPAPIVRETMIDLLDKTVSCDNREEEEIADNEKKAELQLFGSEKNMATLQDLSNLLYTRGRLQELGCTFTTMGELVTYGYPVTLKENEQLFRLGPIYDEQWSSFFSTSHAIRTDGDAAMWADIRTLKRVLVNEGVIFDCNHRRLTHGDGSPKLIRLCTAYDDLHKLWSSEKPTHVLTPTVEKEEETDEGFDDSGCFLDDECLDDDKVEAGLTERESQPVQPNSQPPPPDFRPVQPETLPQQREHRPSRPKQIPTQRESEAQPEPATAYCNQSNRSSLPRNIGWRFSDDIVIRRDSLSDYDHDEPEDNLHITVEVPQRVSEADTAAVPSIFQIKTPDQVLPVPGGHHSLQPVSHNRWSRGRSPLKNYTTASMIYAEQPPINPHDSASTNSDADLKTHATSNSASIKKKGFRGWVRGVFGRAANSATRSGANLGTGG